MTKSSKNDNAKESHLEGVPIDRGWAWVILAGDYFLEKSCYIIDYICARAFKGTVNIMFGTLHGW